MLDFGYDISDYCDIDPKFGSLIDFDNLVREASDRNIKIIMDFVVNHTSDQHDWFQQSKSSKSDSKRDWYVWKDPKSDGSAPNNWQSIFGGSAWELDKQTGQYYLHTFLKEQPDLNWDNPEVRKAMQDVIRFWFNRGVYGIRVDAAQFISKDTEFKDKVFVEGGPGNQMSPLPVTGFGSNFIDYIKVMTSVAEEYPGHFVTFESDPYQSKDIQHYLSWYNLVDNNVAAPFYYGMLSLTSDWSAKTFGQYIEGYQTNLPNAAFPVYFYGNHDTPRLATRIGEENTRLAAMALMTLPGTKVLYYGDELGMENVSIAQKDLHDPGKDEEGKAGRDACRTPMQWSSSEYAGFSEHKPWLPVGDDYKERNVEKMSADKSSILSLYKSLSRLNKTCSALRESVYKPVTQLNDNVFIFERISDSQRILVLLNFSDNTTSFTTSWKKGTLLISTINGADVVGKDLHSIQLKPREGWIVELKD
jgi:alpha-glucosidase